MAPTGTESLAGVVHETVETVLSKVGRAVIVKDRVLILLLHSPILFCQAVTIQNCEQKHNESVIGKRLRRLAYSSCLVGSFSGVPCVVSLLLKSLLMSFACLLN